MLRERPHGVSGESSATAHDKAETCRGDRKPPLFSFKMNFPKFRDLSCLCRGEKRRMYGVKTKRVNIRHQEPGKTKRDELSRPQQQIDFSTTCLQADIQTRMNIPAREK